MIWQFKSNHSVYVHQSIRTQSMFLLANLYIFLILLQKSAKHVLFFISEGIIDQFSIALCFINLAPAFERAFGKANCRSLSEWLLLLVKHSHSGNNWALQCLQSIHLDLGGSIFLHCCASSHILKTEKVFQHIKLTHLRMHFASGSLLFMCKQSLTVNVLFQNSRKVHLCGRVRC